MEGGQQAAAAEGPAAEGGGEAPSPHLPPTPRPAAAAAAQQEAPRPSTAESIYGSSSSLAGVAAGEHGDRSIGGSGSSSIGGSGSSSIAGSGSSSTNPRGATAGSSGSGLPSTTTTAAPAAGAATTAASAEKVKVLLMGVGRAPRLAQAKFQVNARDPFRALYPVLRRLLQLQDGQALFLFVAASFSPGPEDSFGDLFRCFGKTGQLIVNYALDEAWG